MAGRFEESQPALAESDLVALADRHVGELRAGPRAQIYFGSGAGGQFAVAGNEIRMQVALDYVRDAEVVLARGFQVDFHVTLRVDHRGDTF